MWKSTVCTHLYTFTIFLYKGMITRTIFPAVEGTIAEQAVKVPLQIMTWIIFTIRIFKVFVGIFHYSYLFSINLILFFYIYFTHTSHMKVFLNLLIYSVFCRKNMKLAAVTNRG